MWIDNDKITSILDAGNKKTTHFPCTCPICSKKTAHVYIHRHDDRHCGIWTWCSSCSSYSHMSGEAPKWWKNPDFVDVNKLCSEPEYLETISGKIDRWVNEIVPAEKTPSEKPVVMENRFKVRLLADYQELAAGTVGTLVIKDDFRKMTIDFIDAEGKKTNLKIQPERVTNVFEVIK